MMRSRFRSGWGAQQNGQLVALAADQAVIHPERMQQISSEIVREAGLVRQSLEKIHGGDEESGLALLRDLPRSSPLADWKFFVRGLAARYRGDAAECQTNWDRLDRGRKAFQIANVLAGDRAETNSEATKCRLGLLKRRRLVSRCWRG